MDPVFLRQISYLFGCYRGGLFILLTYGALTALGYFVFADRTRATFQRFIILDVPTLGALSDDNRQVAFLTGVALYAALAAEFYVLVNYNVWCQR